MKHSLFLTLNLVIMASIEPIQLLFPAVFCKSRHSTYVNTIDEPIAIALVP